MNTMHREYRGGIWRPKIKIASANCASHFEFGVRVSGGEKEILALPSHTDRPSERLGALFSPIGQSGI